MARPSHPVGGKYISLDLVPPFSTGSTISEWWCLVVATHRVVMVAYAHAGGSYRLLGNFPNNHLLVKS